MTSVFSGTTKTCFLSKLSESWVLLMFVKIFGGFFFLSIETASMLTSSRNILRLFDLGTALIPWLAFLLTVPFWNAIRCVVWIDPPPTLLSTSVSKLSTQNWVNIISRVVSGRIGSIVVVPFELMQFRLHTQNCNQDNFLACELYPKSFLSQ